MYLKILARDDDKSNTLIGVEAVEFFHITDTRQAVRAHVAHADLPLVGNDLIAKQDEADDEDAQLARSRTVRVGWFNVVFASGKKQTVIFDSVAFLCNETGKAVERFLAN